MESLSLDIMCVLACVCVQVGRWAGLCKFCDYRITTLTNIKNRHRNNRIDASLVWWHLNCFFFHCLTNTAALKKARP